MNIDTRHRYVCLDFLFVYLQGIMCMKAKVKDYIRFMFMVAACLTCTFLANAQSEIRPVWMDAYGKIIDAETFGLPGNKLHPDSTQEYLQNILDILQKKGFAESSIDTSWQKDSLVFIQLHIGEKYLVESVIIDSASDPLNITFKQQLNAIENTAFHRESFKNIFQSIIDYYSNRGYPFITTSLSNIQISGDKKVRVQIAVERGVPYVIDSIIVSGKINISKNFLQHHLDIFEKEMYSREKIIDIEKKMETLSFLKLSQPAKIDMLNTGAVITLYVQPTTNNQVDVLIGLLPSSAQTNGKLLVTGEANVSLQNSFGSGEIIQINWQQLQPKSPELNIFFQRPYLFSSPFGLRLNFNLYKRDSSFLNINGQAGFQYKWSYKQNGALYLQSSVTNVLDVDTNLVKQTKTLPETGDFASIGLAMEYNFNNTDYRINPRKGNILSLTAGMGNKKIKKNNSITQIKDPGFDYSKLYDTISLNTYQVKMLMTASHFFPLQKQSALKLSLHTGWLITSTYFRNELFRIGGFRLLRGFDEESIFADRYAVASVEYRYLIGRNSWFYAFADGAATGYKAQYAAYSNQYIGFGLGLALETRAGILNLSLAEGKRNDIKLDWRQSKIHIGFISLF